MHITASWEFLLCYISQLAFELGGGGGVHHQIFSSQVQHAKKNWTQLDLMFCENEGSNRFKIHEKVGSIESKIKEKIDTKYLKIC